MREYPRRGFTGLLLALLGLPWRSINHAIAAPPLQQPDSSDKAGEAKVQVRRYRADAAILLLGVTIFRRSAVGGGQASIEEIIEGNITKRTFFFAAGSDAARAHGVNRLGWMREIVRESGSVPIEVTYFGVLTSSPEESLGQARKSVATPSSGRSTYSAVSGHNTPGQSRSAITHFELPSTALWSDRRLIDTAQATFHRKVDWRETSWPGASKEAPPTFLLELARLLSQPARRVSGRYVYNEQEYLLELDRQQPGKHGGKPDRLTPVHGRIRNQRTGVETTFVIWLEDAPGSIIPVRIEYQPRSFLRLVFESVAV